MMRFLFSVMVFLGLSWQGLFSDIVYVSDSAGSTVSVIETTSNTLITTIPVGSSPRSISFTPDGRFAYVANNGDDTVSVIDASINTVIATVPVGADPIGIGVNPNGNFVYVLNSTGDTISVISTATNTVVDTFLIGDAPGRVGYLPDGSRAYVGTLNDSMFVVIDAIANSVITKVPVGSDPTGVAVTPDGRFAYVVNASDGTYDVLDTATNTLLPGSPFGAFGNGNGGIAITPDGQFAYITGVNDVNVFTVATNTIFASIFVGESFELMEIAFTNDGSLAYVADSHGTVVTIDVVTNTVINTLDIGGSPFGVGVQPATFGLRGVAKKNSFLTETNIFNELTWTAPILITAQSYRVFRDGVLIATVPATQFSFKDNNLKRKQTHNYVVIADGLSGASAAAFVTVRTKS
ncbi:MAG: beta-propeller fold lactonase family protein [Chlamydiia bacterium]|nr:beta-propeller fold lactonase family protein [Chlamydiia bacterium]